MKTTLKSVADLGPYVNKKPQKFAKEMLELLCRDESTSITDYEYLLPEARRKRSLWDLIFSDIDGDLNRLRSSLNTNMANVRLINSNLKKVFTYSTHLANFTNHYNRLLKSEIDDLKANTLVTNLFHAFTSFKSRFRESRVRWASEFEFLDIRMNVVESLYHRRFKDLLLLLTDTTASCHQENEDIYCLTNSFIKSIENFQITVRSSALKHSAGNMYYFSCLPTLNSKIFKFNHQMVFYSDEKRSYVAEDGQLIPAACLDSGILEDQNSCDSFFVPFIPD